METTEAETIKGISDQLKSLFSSSEQAIYIYLDDVHKVCNTRFSSMLGYRSPEEWAAVKISFPEAFVDEGSQDILVSHYQKGIQKLVASHFPVVWKKKPGGSVKTEVILVPILYNGHRLALHYVSEVK
jgi:hypothetical protein